MWVARFTRRFRTVLLILTAALALLVVARMNLYLVGTRAVLGQLRPVTRADVDSKVACLSFDVAWGETVPSMVLDVLKEKRVPATFFVAAPWAASHQQVVRRMVEEGHEVGNLGYRHIRLGRYPKEIIDEEIARSHQILKELCGADPKLFRPPDGDYNDAVISSALEHGYTTVVWSLDSLDYKRLSAPDISKRVITKIRPGDIVLFHASDAVPETPEALPSIVVALKQKGFQLLKISEALKLQAH